MYMLGTQTVLTEGQPCSLMNTVKVHRGIRNIYSEYKNVCKIL